MRHLYGTPMPRNISIDSEKVQRRVARFVLNRYHNTSSVSQMIDKLKWPMLEHRRQTAKLSMIYQIRHGLVGCSTLKSKLVPPPPRQRRGHDQQFNIIITRTPYRGASFLPRTIREWNVLPHKVVEAPTVDTIVSRTQHSEQSTSPSPPTPL